MAVRDRGFMFKSERALTVTSRYRRFAEAATRTLRFRWYPIREGGGICGNGKNH